MFHIRMFKIHNILFHLYSINNQHNTRNCQRQRSLFIDAHDPPSITRRSPTSFQCLIALFLLSRIFSPLIQFSIHSINRQISQFPIKIMDPSDTDAAATAHLSQAPSSAAPIAGDDSSSSPITMHSFLDFLKLSCKVQDQLLVVAPPTNGGRATTASTAAGRSTVTSTTLTLLDAPTTPSTTQQPPAVVVPSGGGEPPLDLNELARHPLVNSLLNHTSPPQSYPSIAASGLLATAGGKSATTKSSPTKKRNASMRRKQSSSRDQPSSQPQLHPALELKLNEVVDEGMLDSVLQYMCPPPSTASTTATAHSTSTSLASAASQQYAAGGGSSTGHRQPAAAVSSLLLDEQQLRQQRATTAQLTAVLASAGRGGDHRDHPTTSLPGGGDSLAAATAVGRRRKLSPRASTATAAK